jgi:hypothetical protein
MSRAAATEPRPSPSGWTSSVWRARLEDSGSDGAQHPEYVERERARLERLVPFDKAAQPRFASPESYTPKHLAERTVTSNAALGRKISGVRNILGWQVDSALPHHRTVKPVRR